MNTCVSFDLIVCSEMQSPPESNVAVPRGHHSHMLPTSLWSPSDIRSELAALEKTRHALEAEAKADGAVQPSLNNDGAIETIAREVRSCLTKAQHTMPTFIAVLQAMIEDRAAGRAAPVNNRGPRRADVLPNYIHDDLIPLCHALLRFVALGDTILWTPGVVNLIHEIADLWKGGLLEALVLLNKAQVMPFQLAHRRSFSNFSTAIADAVSAFFTATASFVLRREQSDQERANLAASQRDDRRNGAAGESLTGSGSEEVDRLVSLLIVLQTDTVKQLNSMGRQLVRQHLIPQDKAMCKEDGVGAEIQEYRPVISEKDHDPIADSTFQLNVAAIQFADALRHMDVRLEPFDRRTQADVRLKEIAVAATNFRALLKDIGIAVETHLEAVARGIVSTMIVPSYMSNQWTAYTKFRQGKVISPSVTMLILTVLKFWKELRSLAEGSAILGFQAHFHCLLSHIVRKFVDEAMLWIKCSEVRSAQLKADCCYFVRSVRRFRAFYITRHETSEGPMSIAGSSTVHLCGCALWAGPREMQHGQGERRTNELLCVDCILLKLCVSVSLRTADSSAIARWLSGREIDSDMNEDAEAEALDMLPFVRHIWDIPELSLPWLDAKLGVGDATSPQRLRQVQNLTKVLREVGMAGIEDVDPAKATTDQERLDVCAKLVLKLSQIRLPLPSDDLRYFFSESLGPNRPEGMTVKEAMTASAATTDDFESTKKVLLAARWQHWDTFPELSEEEQRIVQDIKAKINVQ